MRPTAAPPLVRFPVATPVPALPYPFSFDAAHAALLVIDMQRDFLEPGGFGSALGNDVTLLRQVLPPLVRLLAACRANGMLIVHTREGHRPDLSDLPPAKLRRARSTATIGDLGPMGRILIRGEPGHDIVPELAPAAGELVIDKPGKGAFYATALQETLLQRGIRQLIVTGVTTEVCVHTTLREANDRGYDCLVPADCVGSYLPHLHAAALDMITAQNGIFGWVAPSAALLAALDWTPPSSPPPTSAPLPNCTAR